MLIIVGGAANAVPVQGEFAVKFIDDAGDKFLALLCPEDGLRPGRTIAPQARRRLAFIEDLAFEFHSPKRCYALGALRMRQAR